MPGFRVTHDGPVASWIFYWLARAWLAFFGWNVEGRMPSGGRGVVIASPHTSNWDLPFMLAVAWVFRARLHWLGKHTLFRGWRGPLMRWLGGISVDRRVRGGVVTQAAARLGEGSGMYLAVAPAGTRGQAKHWKSGFYQIARAAQVPIICGFLDYRRKVGGLGPSILPTNDVKADMDRIRAFYRDMTGHLPERSTPILLEEEFESGTPTG